jgi:hypothetical protein
MGLIRVQDQRKAILGNPHPTSQYHSPEGIIKLEQAGI